MCLLRLRSAREDQTGPIVLDIQEQRAPGVNHQDTARRKLPQGVGGGGARRPIPPPMLDRLAGRGFGVGVPYLPCRGGGAVHPNIHGSK